MNLFRPRDKTGSESVQKGNPTEVAMKLESALTAIFSEDGKRTVMYYVANRFGMTLEQATVNPAKFEKALTEMLGELGWMVVKKAILEEFWDKRIDVSDTNVVKMASLHEVFGFVRSVGPGSLLRP